MSVLSVKGLEKSYKKGFIPKKQKVLLGVDFEIEPGKITGFLGANGAGKTTTMKCLLGLAFPDAGEIKYFGDKELSSNIKTRIGFLPERPYFYDYLTGEEFLIFYGELSKKFKRKDLRERIDALLKRVDLFHAKYKKLRDYSKGMLQKIGVAQALIHDPEFIILDEPMSGLDPDGRFYLSEIIKETSKKGTSVFFSSHLLHDAEKLCENLVILKEGKVRYQGATNGLIEEMGQAYKISYLVNGEIKQESVKDRSEIQLKVDEIRKNNYEIDEVRLDRMSLEEAFVKMALRGE